MKKKEKSTKFDSRSYTGSFVDLLVQATEYFQIWVKRRAVRLLPKKVRKAVNKIYPISVGEMSVQQKQDSEILGPGERTDVVEILSPMEQKIRQLEEKNRVAEEKLKKVEHEVNVYRSMSKTQIRGYFHQCKKEWDGPNDQSVLEMICVMDLFDRIHPKHEPKVAKTPEISGADILLVLGHVGWRLGEEPNLVQSIVEPGKKVYVFGDLRGRWRELSIFFRRKKIKESLEKKECKLVFLGNYVNSKKHEDNDLLRMGCDLPTLMMVYCLKVAFPEGVILLRGNEDDWGYVKYDKNPNFVGCLKAWRPKDMKDEQFQNILDMFYTTFETLPLAAVVQRNKYKFTLEKKKEKIGGDKFFLCHGGICEELESVDRINGFDRKIEVPADGTTMEALLWAEYHHKIVVQKVVEGACLDGKYDFVKKGKKGRSCKFSVDAAVKFLDNNDLKVFISGQSNVETGFSKISEESIVKANDMPTFEFEQEDFFEDFRIWTVDSSCEEPGRLEILNSGVVGKYLVEKAPKKEIETQTQTENI